MPKAPGAHQVFSDAVGAPETPAGFVKILNKPRSEIGHAVAGKKLVEQNRAGRVAATGSAGNLLAFAPHDRYK